MHRSGTELINPFKVLERVGVREGFRVADLGCGFLGHFIFPAAQLIGGKGVVYAVDIQEHVLEHIARYAKQEHLYNIVPVRSDIDVYGATRIDDASLDLTLLVNNLFLSQDREALAHEMARLTRPGGRIVIVEWKPNDSPIGPPTNQRLGRQDAKKILKTPYMDFFDEFEAGPYHYGLIYLRTEEPV